MSGSLAATNPEAAAIARRRALADRLMTQATQQDFRNPLSIGATIAQSLAGALTGYRADQDEEARATRQREERQALVGSLLGAMGGGEANVAPAPTGAPPAQPRPASGGGGIRTGAAIAVPPELDDADILARTLLGEAANQGEEGMRAVAHTVRNRSQRTGAGVRDVVLAPYQYEPWGARRQELLAIPTTDPRYVVARNIAEQTLAGANADPTNGATHFLNPDLQRQLGRQQPSWAPEGQGQRIGAHVFYSPGGGVRVGQGSTIPATAQAQTTPQQTAAPQQQRPDQSAAMRGLILQAAMSDDPALQRLAPMLAQMAQREQPNPVSVAPGATLFDPRTRQPIFTAPERPQRSEPPSGYRFAADGRLEAIPGGPADPSRSGGPFAGSGMDAQANNIAIRLAPRIRDGSATPEEQMIYQRAYTHLAGRTLQFITDPTDPTGTRQIGVRVPGDTGDLPPPPSMGAQPAPAGAGAAATVPATGGQNDATAAPAAANAVPGLERVSPPPAGFQRRPDGSLEPIPGGPQDQTRQPLTETAARSNLFGQAMMNGEEILSRVRVPSSAVLLAWRNAPESLVNMGLSANDQQYFNALRQFAAGILRKETGAAFSTQELLDVQSRFFPMPGDSPETQAQKAQARRIAIEAMRAEVPGGFRGLPQTTGPGGQGTADPPSRVLRFDAQGRPIR